MKIICKLSALLFLLPIGSAKAISTEAWYAVPESDGVQRIDIHCGQNFLDPREIVVRRDLPVEFVVRSTRTIASQAHAFVAELPGNRIQQVMGPDPAKINFRPGIPGRYVIACRRQTNIPDDAAEQRAKQGILHVVQ